MNKLNIIIIIKIIIIIIIRPNLHVHIKNGLCKLTLEQFYVLFNDALNTLLINSYICVRSILIGKIPSGYLGGIDLR